MPSPFIPTDSELAQILSQADIAVEGLNVQTVAMPEYAVNRIFIVNDRFILKTSNHENQKLQNEAKALQDIATMHISPGLLAAGQWPSQPGRFYLLETKLSGQTLFELWLQVDNASRKRYIQELAAMMETYQSIDTSHYCIGFHQSAITKWQGSWMDGHDRYLDWLCRKVEPRMGKLNISSLLHEAQQYYTQHRHALEYSAGKRYSHGDLHLYNVIADQQVAGIIDWEWAGLGGVEPDFEFEALFRWAIYPQAIAEEQLEAQVDEHTFALIIPTVLSNSSQLEQTPHLLQRLTIYQIEYELHKISLESGDVTPVVQRLDAWLHRNPLRGYLS